MAKNDANAAKARGDSDPHAIAVAYDRKSDALLVTFKQGGGIIIPRRLLRGPIATASAAQLKHFELLGEGAQIWWPKLDDGLHLADVVEHILGMRLASSVGRPGGSTRTEAKAAAARANGSRGGRPRKQPA